VNQQEMTTYLAASHIAVVATINRHGHPHLTPNWYRYDGKVLTLITRKDRLKYRNLHETITSPCAFTIRPSPRIMSSFLAQQRATTRTSGTKPAVLLRATGRLTRWTRMSHAGKRSRVCSSR
jgi:pyridoxamine 5'-phosphate oxidase-like protein